MHEKEREREREREREEEREKKERMYIYEENIENGYGCAFVEHGHCQIKSTT